MKNEMRSESVVIGPASVIRKQNSGAIVPFLRESAADVCEHFAGALSIEEPAGPVPRLRTQAPWPELLNLLWRDRDIGVV